MVAILWVGAAEAQLVRPFALRFSVNAPGTIFIVGNSVLTCPDPGGDPDCAEVQTIGGTKNNNSFVMTFIDIDGDASTFNSSSADLILAPGTSVLWAGLYWTGETKSGGGPGAAPAPKASARNTVKLATPASGGYLGITASTVDSTPGSANNAYGAFADVTSLVQSAGAGTYTVANVQTGRGPNRSAGWSLVVVVQDPAEPQRDMSVFDGFANVTDTPEADAVSTTVTGFKIPDAGPFTVQLGVVGLEGDSTTGDRLKLEGVDVGSVAHPTNNFFRSEISRLGVPVTTRNPAYPNTLGYDIAMVEANGILPNGATSATLTFATTGDQYFPQLVTFMVEVIQPSLETTKTAADVNGPNLVPGDTVEYTITVENTGNETAAGVVLSDPIPADTTYVPGSLAVTAGPNAGAKSDVAGDDQADFDAVSGNVRFRLGNGATATDGGSLAPGASTTVRFRVKINLGVPAGGDIANQATVGFAGEATHTGFVRLSDGEPDLAGSQPTTISVADADVMLTKVAGAAAAQAGGLVSFTITATNNGPARSRDVTVQDTLPAGTVLASLQPSAGGSCLGVPIGGTGTLTCKWSGFTAVGPAGARSVVVGLRIAASFPNGGSLVNTATVSTLTPDSNPANNTASATTIVSTSADLRVTKTGPATAVAGTDATYTIQVKNFGPSNAQPVTLNDPAPPGLTFVSATAPCAGGFPCALGAMAAGATVSVDVTFSIDSGYAGPDPIVNTATASSTTSDPLPANNTRGWATVLAADQANLAVTKTAPATAVAGEDITFTITVTSSGPSDAVGANVELSDGLADALTFQSITPPAGWTCATPEVGESGPITCTTPVLVAGASAVFTLVGRVSASEPTGPGFGNTATVASAPVDPVPGDNSDSSTSEITAQADLRIVKTGPAFAVAGTDVTYTIEVTNLGPSDADDVVILDPAPAGLTFVSANGACAAQGLPCVLGAMPAGTTETVDVRFRVAPGLATAAIVNTAAVDSGTPDPNPLNDSSTSTIPLTRVADLGVTKTGPASIVAGQPITYSMVVTNAGPSSAAGVTLADPTPAGLTFVSSTCGPFPCSLGTLAAGGVAAVSATYAVPPGYQAPDVIVNTATVSASTSDPNPANNTASASTAESEQADVQVTKTGPASAIRGNQVTYTITVTNAGPSTAAGVTLTDPTPPGLVFISTSCGAFPCALGALAPGASASVTATYGIPPTYDGPDPIVNRATAMATTPDPALANNNGAWATELSPNQADLSVTKTGPATVNAGGVASYDVTVTNAGPSAVAANASLVDSLPPGMTFLSIAAPPGWACVTPVPGATGPVTCSNPVIPPGAFAFVIQGRLATSVAGGTVITNSATVSSTSADPDPANNTRAAASTAQVSADLRVTKTGPATVVAGTQATYTIEIVNLGPSDAQGVTLADPTPTWLVFVSASAPCAGGFPCPLGALVAGASRTVTATFAVPPAYASPDPIVNTATVAATTPDPVPANNAGGGATALAPALTNLSVTRLCLPPGAVHPGDTITCTVTVTNTGPSAAANVTLDETLSSGLVFVSLTAPAGWNCVTPPAGSSGLVACAKAQVAVGTSVITVVVRVAPSATGTVTTSGVIGSSTSNASANTSSAESPRAVIASANLHIAKTGPATVAFGAAIVYEITVTNNGPSDAQAVVVDDPTPAGLVLVSVSAPCAGGFPCVLGTLPAGAGVQINATYALATPQGIATPITNQATVTASTSDPAPDDNSARHDIEVSTPAIPSLAPGMLVVLVVLLGWLGLRRIRSPRRVAHGRR
jgi:large repetitive protein